MGLTSKEVERIADQFAQKYFYPQPYCEYVNMCGISKVGVVTAVNKLPSNKDEQDDWCIIVGLCKPLPQDLSLPTEYQGVKVFVKKSIGEIRFA